MQNLCNILDAIILIASLIGMLFASLALQGNMPATLFLAAMSLVWLVDVLIFIGRMEGFIRS